MHFDSTIRILISNIIARFWGTTISLIMIPIYLDLLGTGNYGFIGFYATLVGSLAILDLGISSTLSREIAQRTSVSHSAESIRDLVYSLECLYWFIGIILSLSIVLFAPIIAKYWLVADEIPQTKVKHAIVLMGVLVGSQWPTSIYSGSLFGLQRHVYFNIIIILFSTLKAVGVLLVLTLIANTIEVFFIWQILIGVLYVISLRVLLWCYLPVSIRKAKFSISEIKSIWKFAAGMTGISLASFCLTQLDKILLSKLLSISDFGLYTIAWTAGTGLLLLLGIMTNVFLPKLSGTAASNDNVALINRFHIYNKLIANVVIPIGLLICFYCKEILFIWLQADSVTDRIYLAVVFITIGTTCNALMHIPYYYMIAIGVTKYTIYVNVLSSIILVPLLFFLTDLYGINGAAMVWMILNIGYVAISLPLIHYHYLKFPVSKTYLLDIAPPLIISLIVLSIFRQLLFANDLSTLQLIVHLCLALIICFSLIIGLNSLYRKFIYGILINFQSSLKKYYVR